LMGELALFPRIVVVFRVVYLPVVRVFVYRFNFYLLKVCFIKNGRLNQTSSAVFTRAEAPARFFGLSKIICYIQSKQKEDI
jgi:hypothetical protein